MSAFLIDARFLLRNATEAFWGAPLIVMDGRDNTFCYGFMRDLLRLRNLLHITAGAVAFGSDTSSLAKEEDVCSVLDLCRKVGLVVVEERKSPMLAIVAAHTDRFSDIVTDDPRLLYFCTEKCAIHLGQETTSIERMTPDGVKRRLGVPVQCVPSYLALTEGGKHVKTSPGDRRALTAREARRLVEMYGALPCIYHHLSEIKSPILRKKLADNQKIFGQRYQDNTSTRSGLPARLPASLAWKLDTAKVGYLFRERGFYSLLRMLPLPDTPAQLQETTIHRVRATTSYGPVLNRGDFNALLERITRSKVCAIDTEADDKDPRQATLFGISFALAPGEVFFVPFCERDMGDLTPNVVQRGLRLLFKQRTRFVGHNLKYDLTLLRRNAIEPPVVTFDTLLAAYECYGDLDFFNLPYLAQKFLGRKISSYKEIVGKGKTLLGLPFEEMMDHACTDADTALRLYTFLEKELKNRNINRQFEERTMPLSRTLMNLEKDGVPVDRKRLERVRTQLVDRMHEVEGRVVEIIGGEIDLDSHEDISILVRERLGLKGALGRKPLTQSLLEQLACHRPMLKLVVEYRRVGKQLRRLDSIIKAIRGGRVYPLLSQKWDGHGRISSTDPDLFADDGLEQLRDCVGGGSQVWFKDKKRSLDLIEQASRDQVLKKDRSRPQQLNLFMNGQKIMSGVDHDELLLSVLIGESLHRLSTRFLMDRLTVSSIVHALETRYSKSFRYLADSRAQGLKLGYVEREGIRRYFNGFGSSSIEKRNRAQLLACRWLLQY